MKLNLTVHSSGTGRKTGKCLVALPLVVGSRPRRSGGHLPAELVGLLPHAVTQRDEVALQDDQALTQPLSREGAFGQLSRQLLLVFHEDHQTVF